MWFLQVTLRLGYKYKFISLGGSAWASERDCYEEFNRIQSEEVNQVNLKKCVFLDLIDTEGNLKESKLISKQNGMKIIGIKDFDHAVLNANKAKQYAIGDTQQRYDLLDKQVKVN